MTLTTQTQTLTNWGNTKRIEAQVARPENISHIQLPNTGTILCQSAGQSYGDAALNASGVMLSTECLNRLLALNVCHDE